MPRHFVSKDPPAATASNKLQLYAAVKKEDPATAKMMGAGKISSA